MLKAEFVPVGSTFAGCVKNPGPDVLRNGGVCQCVNEDTGSYEPAFRMPPAQQSLCPDDLSVIEPDLRLIVQDKFPVLGGTAQFQIELLPRMGFRAHRRQE